MGAIIRDAPLGYVVLSDIDGLRNVIRVSAIQMLSDTDQCRDSTMAVVAGRVLTIPLPLDDILVRIDKASGTFGRSRS